MPRTARLTAIALAAAVVALSLPATQSSADDTAAGDSTLIVTFEAGQADPSAAARAAVTAAGGGDIVRVRPITARTVAVTLDDTTAREARVLNARLEAQSAVRASDTATRFYPSSTNDPYYRYLWNLNNGAGSTYGIDAEDAWQTSTGSGVVIAVIDTGITVHSDLTGPGSIVGGNAVAGYDFISEAADSGDGNGYDSNPTDVLPGNEYHGTHVAGTIAAIANNGKGVVGVAPGAKVQPIRVLGQGGGTEPDIIAAILWAAGLTVYGAPANPTKASVINLSLGGAGTCDPAMQSAINAAIAAGSQVVVAAGNGDATGNGIALSDTMPANCDGVIRVTASTNAGTLSAYSNFGTSGLPATIAAPGGSATDANDNDPDHWILSTWHNAGESYTFMEGTSMAAPHVAGTLALMIAANPGLSSAHRLDLLTSTTKAFSGGCTATTCGAGIANASAAVAAAVSASPDLTITRPGWSGPAHVGSRLTATASASTSAATVSWQWLRDGAPISGATASSYVPAAADWKHALSVRATAHLAGAAPAQTSAAATVAPGAFVNSRIPSIKGKYKVGRKLSASAGAWSPTSTKTSYQWLRNDRKISGATGSHHKLTRKDRGKKISVSVTVTRTGYTSTTLVSARHKVR